MKSSTRPSAEVLRRCFDTLKDRHSANELAVILGVHKETARRMARILVEGKLVQVVSERSIANRNSERIFQKAPGAVWPDPPLPKGFVLPDPYMFRMVALRPGGIHA